MGFADDYFNELNKKKKKNQQSVTSTNNYATEYHNALQKISEEEKGSALSWRNDEDDIAPVRGDIGTDKSTVETTQAIFDKYGQYYNSPDYDEYSQKGASIKNPTFEEAEKFAWRNLLGKPTWEKEVNAVTYSRENYDSIALMELNNNNSQIGKSIYRHMTDFEVGIYNYLLAKEGKDAAQDFLDDMEETLNARLGGEQAELVKNIDNDVLKAVAYGGTSLVAGTDSFATGVKQLFSEEALPTTSIEATNSILLEGLDGFAKQAYQTGNVVGNMMPSVAVGAINPKLGHFIQGSSAAGNAYRNSLKEGKTKEEAATFGVMIGAMEYITSKFIGGVEGMTGSLPQKALKNIATFENALLRVGAKYAVNIGSEITEEELQLWLEPAARSLVFGEDYDAPTLEEMAETAIVTALSTGILNSSTDIATGNLTKVNGLTQHEAKVVDKLYNDAIAEKESDGKKLTNKDKNKLYDRIVYEMKRGYVTTDEIESILGGETYKGYKDLTDKKTSLEERKTAIEEEIKSLVKTPETQFTVEQREKLNSLREEAKGIDDFLANPGIDEAKNKLFNEVNKLTAKDTYLRESYNDLIRQTQDLQIDENQYNGTKFADAAKKTIANARKAEASNSNRVRDFVEFSAKYSSVSGTVVDFADKVQINKMLEDQIKSQISELQTSTVAEDKEKLAELQKMLKQVQEGKIHVNGIKTKDGVTINLESPNYLNTILGHEVTHFLEEKNGYEALQKAIFKHAQNKGDYEGRRKALEALYKNIDGTTVDYELTADLVGDYLFTEYDFIKNLSTENRNVFQQIYDQVKYMFKLATAGSKEARELEKVMHQFERALRESVESGQNADGKTKFSMSGEKSKTADSSLLSEAKNLLETGVESETIRQKTGWHKGYDGKWRYEIDDSKLKYYPDADAKGYSKDPDVLRVRELFEKHQNGKATEAEFEEMRSLISVVGFEKMFPTRLSDYVAHDKLFEAYPQLKDMSVSVRPLSENTNADYNLHTKTISINENIINDDEAVKNALIHEIQHAIQDIEGFAQGASVEYWKAQRQDIVDTISGARANLDLWLDDIGYSDFAKSSMQEVANKEKTIEQHWEDCKEFKANSKYAKQIANCEAELAEFQRQYDEITNGMTAYEQYRNTAGEIEARDAENRLNLTAEERKNTRPDIDRSDVVFAENRTASYAIKHDKNGNKYWEIDSGKDIFKGLNTPEEYRDAAFKYLIANRDNKVTIKDNSGNDIVFIRLSAEEFTHSNESEELFENNPEMFNQKMRLAPSLEDILMNANVNWHSPDHKNHKLFKEKGFENYRGKVRIDNVIFNSIVRVGKADFGDVFYDINLEVDSYLPHTKSDASDINESTSIEDIIAPLPENVNTQFSLSAESDTKSEDTSNKQKQFEIIQETNPMWDDYHTGIRSVDDIRTWTEVLELNDESEGQFVWGDFSRTDAEQALKDGTITVYSSYPIKNGVFVSTSYIQAQEYAGGKNGKVYSKTIPLTDVAWINGDEGQYAKADVSYSLSYEGEKRTLGGSYRFDGKDFKVKSNQDIAPVAEGIAKNATTTNAPVAEDTTFDAPMLENIPVLPDEELEQGTHTAIRPKPEKQPSLKKVNNAESKEHIAQVLTEEPKVEKKKKGIISTAIRNFVDKGAVFENLSLKTKNRALQDTYKAMGRSETKAQYFMENGTKGIKSLDSIREEVEQTGKTKEFYEYLYHKLNIDRMSLESKEQPNLQRLKGEMKKLKLDKLQENQLKAIASEKITEETAQKRADLIKTVREYLASKDVKNKPVFDYSVTSEMSQDKVNELESANPNFKEYAQDVYNYMNHLRQMMVDKGVISQETADLWSEMYPHYVPIRRVGHEGVAVNVPLDTGRTGINAPIKKATGGNSDILPLFETMAQRTSQTFKAIDKNSFGVELKNTLGNVVESTKTNIDEVIDSIDAHESLLQEGKNGKNPTFTVFEGGERVTFEITDEMYDALKPTSEGLSYTNKVLNTASNLHRGVLTEYSVPFMVTNAIKDAQDVLINSQHATKTYAKFPTAINELRKHGKWYTEYMENGGGDNTYFDKQTNAFNKEKSQLRKIIGFPFDKISDVNNFIEKVPRLAEYIASRESGASIDAAMLDAARVTTDFSAGGDVTKFLNRNGATFLNASVQGFAQQVRNVREAKMNGLKGWLGLATKITLAGLPAMLLNKLLWDDDEEYEELSDYVKENYYVVAKYGDGKFVRIPKGRTLAVIQNGFEQISNTLTGDDEADFGRFFELFLSNLAPNNPLDNNIIAPIKQVMENKTWYGEDLVPSRLQDLPAAEQFDESTDAISKWLGENINVSPYKINYLLNQYSGGIGDIFLPMMTPEAESGDNSLGGNIIAPLKDKFTTDSVMNNQNVSDFYDTVDVLTKNAKSSYATDEDILKNKYINSVNTELGDLYKAKREIQNSNLSDSVKYAQVRSIQDQINNLAKNALNSYEKVNIQGGYATVGDKHYRLDDGVWTKISDKQLERQQEVTNELGISPSEYWSKTDISYFPNSDGEFEYAYDNPEKYAVSKLVGGYDTYKTYSKELYNIKSDKDENGKSISGSRKEKVLNYINNLDADYETKIILWKSEYPSDDTYNMEIINYINNRTDLTYEERVSIFTELGFTVSDGSVYWD